MTLELLVSAHPNVSYRYNLTTLITVKNNSSSKLTFSFMEKYIRVLTQDNILKSNIYKYTYDDPKLEQHLTAIIAKWI